jgi:hypothetical protein
MNSARQSDLLATLESLHSFGEGRNGAAMSLSPFIINSAAPSPWGNRKRCLGV